MRWCARCSRRLYDESAAFCPLDGTRLEVPSSDGDTGSDPHIGTTLLGQFHLLAAIGSGAMGTVYRAWQSGMERTVAVKLLRADLLGDQELRRRFLREGRASARLNHPNIVSVYMVGETEDGVPYLVMEELGGQTLDELLDLELRLPPPRAIAIARQMASALAEAHGAGVVHRDLKPGNVFLLRRRGAGELVKIFDFGIAKLAEGTVAGASRLTRDGDIFGTPHYIAPEQAQGGSLDGRADLYSLGVLLYRMLSGRLPFDGNAVAVLLAHIGHPPPELGQIAPDLAPGLTALVMRCLAKDPDRRFACADELIEALDREAARPAPDPQPPRIAEPIAPAARTLPARGDRSAASSAGQRRAGSGHGRLSSSRPASASASSAATGHRGAGGGAGRRFRRLPPLAALAIVCVGGGTGASALLRHGSYEPAAGPRSLQRVQMQEAARRSVMVGEGGYTVRALLPDPIAAGRSVELLFDVWDPEGRPVQAPAIPVELASLTTPDLDPGGGADTALAARPLPGSAGRYRLVARFPVPGEAALLLELAGESALHIHLDVAPAADPL